MIPIFEATPPLRMRLFIFGSTDSHKSILTRPGEHSFFRRWAKLITAILLTSYQAVIATAAQPGKNPVGHKVQATQNILRFADVCSLVSANNDNLKAMRYLQLSAQRSVGPAGAWDDPMLMAGVQNLPTSLDFGADMMTMTMFGLSVNLPYSGYKGLQRKAAIVEEKLARNDVVMTENQLYAAALTAYVDVYTRQVALYYLREERNLADKALQSIKAKYITAAAGATDLAAAEAEIGRLDSDILSAEQEHREAVAELYALCGQTPPNPTPEIRHPEFDFSFEPLEVLLENARNYPAYARLNMESEKYSLLAGAAKRMRWPMISLSGYYGIRQANEVENPIDMIGFQVSLSLPVFSGRRQGSIAVADEALRIASEARANQLWQETRNRLESLTERIRRLNEAKEIYANRVIPADSLALNSAMVGFVNGTISFVELTAQLRNIYRDLTALARFDYEIARAYAELSVYTGARWRNIKE